MKNFSLNDEKALVYIQLLKIGGGAFFLDLLSRSPFPLYEKEIQSRPYRQWISLGHSPPYKIA
jgi:hypothetical protein